MLTDRAHGKLEQVFPMLMPPFTMVYFSDHNKKVIVFL